MFPRIVQLRNQRQDEPDTQDQSELRVSGLGDDSAKFLLQLREYAKAIRDLIAKGEGDLKVQNVIKDQMSHIYRIVAICLGVPSETFTFSYYDKNKTYHSIGPITPKAFYTEHVKPVFDVDNKVCIVTDPRPSNEYGKVYTVDCLGNVVGGRLCIYNNQPVELLLEITAKSIRDGEAVWFGCEVMKRFAGKQGILDTQV
jgi:bleomycin hydrolase